MTEKYERETAEVIRAVESILAKDKSIIAVAERALKKASKYTDENERLRKAASSIIARYSNLSATAAAVSTIPGLIPGIGTVLTAFGGGIIDVVCSLKFELEMALCLAHLFGHDITDDRERKIAYLMASTAVNESMEGKSTPAKKMLRVVDIAFWEYSTRQMSKSFTKSVTLVILQLTTKRATQLFPFVGMVIGASFNKVLTTNVGKKCLSQLMLRKHSTDTRI